MFTRLTYVYRDAGNYKQFGDVILSRRMSDEQRQRLWAACDSGRLFVANQVGLPSLAARLQGEWGGRNADDHGWHELVEAAPVADLPEGQVIWSTVEAITARFASVGEWNLLTPETA